MKAASEHIITYRFLGILGGMLTETPICPVIYAPQDVSRGPLSPESLAQENELPHSLRGCRLWRREEACALCWAKMSTKCWHEEDPVDHLLKQWRSCVCCNYSAQAISQSCAHTRGGGVCQTQRKGIDRVLF